MSLTVTPIYAALLVALFLYLTFRVIAYRRANTLSLGDYGDKNLLKRMRAQANFIEVTPLALILLLISELQGAPALALHILGLLLLAGRLLHALGFAATPQKIFLRQLGMLLNMVMLVFAALGILAHALL
ncbi:hypothetical protein SAMN04488523_10117 [Sulfitobacter brevis]|uniref:Glutathione S-transferase n=1 Tax=Sulfitobacter brevis TaxID=74348 RepID=A0A1I1SQ87_9RHOB|nr:MAPEG family protein [Sulfitobacter brevis]SFD45220.1 hypothetical protein SAMN04488523_10117 [Sulfitobacter brevis]